MGLAKKLIAFAALAAVPTSVLAGAAPSEVKEVDSAEAAADEPQIDAATAEKAASDAADAAADSSEVAFVENVATLNGANFSKQVEEGNRFNLVKFYAPWCGHCKSLAEPFKEAAKTLKEAEDKPDVALADVDATVETELAERFQVQGYPTLLFFINGSPTEYSGPRTAGGIVDWVREAMKPALVVKGSEELLEAAVKDKRHSDAVYVYYGDEKVKEYAGKQADETRALGTTYFVEGSATNKVVVHRGVGETVTLEADKVPEEGADICEEKDGKKQALALEKWGDWVKSQRIPRFGQITEENYEIYVDVAKKGMFWVCLDSKNLDTEVKKYANEFIEARIAEEKRSAAAIAAAKEKDGDKAEVEGHSIDTYPMVWIDTAEFEDHAKKELGCTSFPTVVLQRGDLLGDAEETKVDKFIRRFGKESGDVKLSALAGAKEDAKKEDLAKYETLDKAAVIEFFEDVRANKLEAVPEPDELDLLDEEEDDEGLADDLDGLDGGDMDDLDGLDAGMGGEDNLDELDEGDASLTDKEMADLEQLDKDLAGEEGKAEL